MSTKIPYENNRVCTGDGKLGKSWNLSAGQASHGKAICSRRIKRRKDKKSKTSNIRETGFNFSTNGHKHTFYPL